VVAAEPASAANLRSQRAVHVAASPPPKVAWKLLRAANHRPGQAPGPRPCGWRYAGTHESQCAGKSSRV
jgi:hypothetical protein